MYSQDHKGFVIERPVKILNLLETGFFPDGNCAFIELSDCHTNSRRLIFLVRKIKDALDEHLAFSSAGQVGSHAYSNVERIFTVIAAGYLGIDAKCAKCSQILVIILDDVVSVFRVQEVIYRF